MSWWQRVANTWSQSKSKLLSSPKSALSNHREIHTYSPRKKTYLGSKYLWSIFPVNRSSRGGTSVPILRHVRGLRWQLERLPRPPCPLLCGMMQPPLWNLPWELSGQPWMISPPLHSSVLISLQGHMKIKPCIFVKNVFPDGIRESWSKSRPWWAVYPGTG